MSGTARPVLGLLSGWDIGEAGWGIDGFNPNFDILDSVCSINIKNQYGLSAPPGSPAEGDVYWTNPVPGSPTGAWTGQHAKLALWIRGAWVFITPRRGWLATVAGAPPLLCRFRPAGEYDTDAAWERLLPDKVPTIVHSIYYPGTPTASSIFHRMVWPASVSPGRAFSANMFLAAESEIRPGTRPSTATTINVRKRDLSGGTTSLGNFVVSSSASQNLFAVNTPLEISFGSSDMLEFVAPANLNGMADTAVMLVFRSAVDFLTEITQ